jgi:serine/threonine-protein kinase
VSPQNVLVTYDGIVKLVDFGVAKAVGRATAETTAGQLKGKIPYMSPEQAKGGAVDRRTDVFAMGIVLYKMTTGAHPFQGQDDMATMHHIISRPVLPPRVRNASFSPELEEVLLRCLQKDPADRYASMLELDRALERVLAVTGASVVDDDVGAFVRTVMGDRGQKRRAALRDAVRAADERAIQPPPAVPVVHEALSDIVLTKMGSGVKGSAIGDRASLATSDSAHPSMPNPVLDLAHNLPLPMFDDPVLPPPKSARAVLVVFGAAVTTAAIGIALVLTARSSGNSSTASEGFAKGAISAVATASASASGPVPTPVRLADLPDVEEKPAEQPAEPAKKRGAPPSKAGGPIEAPSSADAAAPRSTSTTWVPSVRNPGF